MAERAEAPSAANGNQAIVRPATNQRSGSRTNAPAAGRATERNLKKKKKKVKLIILPIG
jgi:hypothetical protein